jgi:hypothetical protein
MTEKVTRLTDILERMLRGNVERLMKQDDYLIEELRAELKAMSVPPTEEWADALEQSGGFSRTL